MWRGGGGFAVYHTRTPSVLHHCEDRWKTFVQEYESKSAQGRLWCFFCAADGVHYKNGVVASLLLLFVAQLTLYPRPNRRRRPQPTIVLRSKKSLIHYEWPMDYGGQWSFE